MFIYNLTIKNYKLFNDEFKILNFNVPDNKNAGTGLTTLVGENGCGKTTILDAIACSLLEYKAESFDISDMNYSNKETEITIETNDIFNVKSVFPNSSFDAKGFKFIGNSYLNLLSKVEDINFSLFNVTFEPRCRNNWHIHHSTKGGGQILIVVDGEGWYQEEGKEPRSLKVGDVVTIPPNVKHWHGAKANSWFSHLAIEVPGEETSNEWCKPVSDEEYNKLS